LAKQTRRVSSPAVLKPPKTRRDKAFPHYETPASVQASVLTQVCNMRRCIIAADGKPVSSNRFWQEILVNSYKVEHDLEADAASVSFQTEDGRQWLVLVSEKKEKADGRRG
jgi:hypothetical protein